MSGYDIEAVIERLFGVYTSDLSSDFYSEFFQLCAGIRNRQNEMQQSSGVGGEGAKFDLVKTFAKSLKFWGKMTTTVV